MSDSPKCPLCLESGEIAQTYKISGKAAFKCQRCGRLFRKEEFKEIDYKWKDSPEEWEKDFHKKISTYEDSIRTNLEKQHNLKKEKK